MSTATTVLTDLEMKLINEGVAEFSLYDMNKLIVFVAVTKEIVYSDVTTQVLLDYHKEIRIGHFSELCEDAIVEGFTASNGHTYRTNRDDQMNMAGQWMALQSDPSVTTVSWKTEDAGYIDHTRAEWLGIYAEAFNHKKEQLIKYNTLKVQITNATTDVDVVAVKF